MIETPFYDCHIKANAKIVAFCGYALPINYGSQIKEHQIVRSDAGMFDVSHMQVIDLTGPKTKDFLRFLLSNDITKLDKHGIGKALYSAILNKKAGVIDDLIVYLLEDRYRIIANAGTREKDLAWITSHAIDFQVEINVRNDLAMLAIQGPNAIEKVSKVSADIANELKNLKQFSSISYNDCFYARTGYTGENGLEVLLPNSSATEFWEKLIDAGVTPCGLGARDTLRLEAGMNLYGHDMDEKITPLECNMDWVVDTTNNTRNFIGKEAYLEKKQKNNTRMQVGIILQGKGVLREGQTVLINDKQAGVVTSGTFSPTLNLSIGFARIDNINDIAAMEVDIRGIPQPIKCVKLPFVRNGKILVNI
ncbi:MAG: glycine cleavage system aminomethyltransferase GcvT [Neisseriaceae bacterium]